MTAEPVPPRTFANRSDVGLVLLVCPAGHLLAENLAGRVKVTRYASSPDVMQGGPAHKRLTADQLEAVREAMDAARLCGKPYRNDWTPTPPPPWWHPLSPERPCTASTSLPTPPPPCPSDTRPTPPPSSSQ